MVVVTRHPALVEYLVAEGIVPSGVDVLSHATPEQLQGQHVVGVLPLQLAALCEKVTVVPLRIPSHLRGIELDVAQLREFAGAPQTFSVREL